MKIFPDFKYGWLPEEFQTRLPNELDFNKEADSAMDLDDPSAHESSARIVARVRSSPTQALAKRS